MISDQAKDGLRLLLTDFEAYSRNCVKIRPKEGESSPFILNKVQLRLLEAIEKQRKATGKVRVIVLKARQQGISTFASAYLYWDLSKSKSKKGLVIAHKAKSTDALFQMYRRIHDEMPLPGLLKPHTKYSSRRELVFDKLDTGIIIETAGGEGIARGETITHAHLSELAFWGSNTADENFNGLEQSIPNADNTVVFIESTAFGMSGKFFELWEGAVRGTNGYIPFFSAWFETDEYREPIPAHFERTIEEDQLAKKFGLDDQQLQWRRTKIALNGRDKFEQEYPATPDEAFKASGRPVFVPEFVNALKEKAPKSPLYKMALEGEKWQEHSCGELSVYRELERGELYTIGVDVALGIKNGDYSVAQVLDSEKRQVAIWRGHIEPYHFANVLNHLGLYYNSALLAVEHNQHGLATLTQLHNAHQYPNLYFDIIEGKSAEDFTERLGFFTSVKSKALIIDRLRAALRDKTIDIVDLETIREMQTYIATESGSLEAEKGCHDDCVMSLAIANHVHVRKAQPYDFSSSYVTAL